VIDDVLDLLLVTAHAVFGREVANPWAQIEQAGLLELPNVASLEQIAAVVAVSAYHATTVPFAEHVMIEPLRSVGAGEDELYRRGALMRSVQLVGALRRVRDLTVVYASERQQFGQPLNRFQAVQQAIAELVSETALAGAAAEAAAAEPGEWQIASAKITCGRAAGRVATIAHQVHGAIGFTYEHPLHHFTSRLWQWRDDFGTEAEWAERVGHSVARAGADAAWPWVTSGRSE
jgi:Acyl-CoA dehydrogenase, C-terminal domain